MKEEQIALIDEMDYNRILYPGVIDRIKAVVVDSCVYVGLVFLFSMFDMIPQDVRIISLACFFGLYDPIFTSFFGGTIGHMVMGIRVKMVGDQDKNIPFPLAIVRYVIKFALGWVSLLTVGHNKNRLAIHDMAIGSIVVRKK